MRIVVEYPINLAPDRTQKIACYAGARFRSIGPNAKGELCTWAEVDTKANRVDRVIFLVPTDERVPADAYHFIATIRVGPKMFHFFSD